VDLEAELDRLYQGPPATFVAERNKLSAELRRSGDRAAATAVSGLQRPSPVAWVVNQLYFRAGETLDALQECGRALRRAQESPGDEDFTTRNREHQEALRGAVDRAVALATEAGLGDGGNLKRRLELTLTLLSAAPDEVEPRPGRMSVELEPVGFDAFTAVASPAPRKEQARAKNPEDAARTQKMEAVQEALDAADKEFRRLERETERAEARYERAVRDADEAEERAKHAREARDLARQSADEAKARQDAARRALDDARRALEGLPK
jgi:hypothetical protein